VTSRREVIIAGHTGDLAAIHLGLADPDAVVRGSALGALERAGELTSDHLTIAAQDPDYRVRRRAAELSATYPLVDLLVFLNDADPLVIEMASWACGEREETPPKVLDRLSELVNDHPDALVREAAVAALGAIGDERGLPAILAAVSDKPAIRRRAVIALAPFDGPEVDAAYAKALKDRDWQVRQAAEDLADEP
jgi:HEAT repeat protein